MPTESEIKLARYNKIEREADEFGRLIGVRRLKPSEKTKIAGMTTDLSGSDDVLDSDGSKLVIPHRLPLMIAASVCEIDGNPISFPKIRGELDAIYDRLDSEGLSAAGRAYAKLQNGDDAPDNALEAAKN